LSYWRMYWFRKRQRRPAPPCPSPADVPAPPCGAGPPLLLEDLGDHAGADGAATFADGEAQALVHRDRVDQLDLHLHVVARHHHLGALRQRHRTGDVGGAEVELRTVA